MPLTSTDYSRERPIILNLCLEPSYYSGIILTKLVTYYSEDYAGIIGAGLIPSPNGMILMLLIPCTFATPELDHLAKCTVYSRTV